MDAVAGAPPKALDDPALLRQLRDVAGLVWHARGGLHLELGDLVGAGWLGYQAAAARGVNHAGCMARARGAMLDELYVIAGQATRASDLVVVSSETALRAAAAPTPSPGPRSRLGGRHRRDHRGFTGLPRHLRRALGRLSAKQQAALRLVVMAGYPADHVGAMLGVSGNAVYLARHAALKALRQRYGVPQPSRGSSQGNARSS